MQEQETQLKKPIATNLWRQAIDDTPGNTSEKMAVLSNLNGLSYEKIRRVYRGDTRDLRSSDAIKVIIQLNEWRKGKTILIIPQEFFLSLSVHKAEH